ncbi:hypothetical protein swp_2316 [Shewanella piezotolerans WP3]|uniref:Uncharacterized protein n=1 Tax=Shewanella piezotolerans (strain WP3 / JCM 13877) TaxID=225849 RepID=B8CNU2_SHEPW|nr:hypothetical protein swp_2316 [Shewanella piezotolerans WP3]
MTLTHGGHESLRRDSALTSTKNKTNQSIIAKLYDAKLKLLAAQR